MLRHLRPLASAFVAGFLLVLVACVTVRDRALLALRDARPTAEQFAAELHSRCTLGYAGAITRDDVARLDAVCLPARAALNDYRDAWVDLLLALQRDADDETIARALAILQSRATVLRWPPR